MAIELGSSFLDNDSTALDWHDYSNPEISHEEENVLINRGSTVMFSNWKILQNVRLDEND